MSKKRYYVGLLPFLPRSAFRRTMGDTMGDTVDPKVFQGCVQKQVDTSRDPEI